MHNRMPLYRILYYVVFLLAFLGCWWLLWFLLSFYPGGGVNLGLGMLMAFGVAFFCIPAGIAIFARLSLLRWYVDPFAAALVPVCLYFIFVIDRIKLSDGFWEAFVNLNQQLIGISRLTLYYFIGLFLFGLVVSFSIARKEGRSIAFKWIEILESCGKKEEIAEE